MKEIALTQGQIALVDDEDFEYLSQWKWYAHRCRHTFYARRKLSRRDGIHMHTQIMQTPKGMEVDHRDRHGLNNQRFNLRIVTRAINGQNRHDNRPGTHGRALYGFTALRCGKYQAQLTRGKTTYYLGLFLTPEEAHHAYQKKRAELGKSTRELALESCEK